MENETRYLFFLSYANLNRELAPIEFEKFKKDLLRFVLEDTRIESENAFVDRTELEIGDDWEKKILGALQKTRAMVCLCSTKFFASSWCGVEFEFMQRRIDAWETSNPGQQRPAKIIPVLWDVGPAVTQQPSLQRLQHDTDCFPKAYRSQGLKSLMMTRRDDREYNQVMLELAKRIVQVIEAPGELPRLDDPPLPRDLENPFALGNRIVPRNADVEEKSIGKQAGFIFAVGKQWEVENGDRFWEGYGPDSFEWQPFFPKYQENIGQIAQKVSAIEGLLGTWIDLPEDPDAAVATLRQEIDAITGQRNLVVAIVDPCSLSIDRIREAMSEMDKMGYGNVGIIISKNEDFPGLNIGCQKLTEAFPNNIRTRHTREYIDCVTTRESLEDHLSKLIVRLRDFILNGPRSDDNYSTANFTDQPPGL